MSLRKMVPEPVRRTAYNILSPFLMRNFPDRRFMTGSIIPALGESGARKVFFVGAQAYTRHYPGLFARHGMEVWTCDILPEVARFGARGRHRTLNIVNVRPSDFPVQFDAIVLNGVIGWGVNQPDDVRTCFQSLAAMLKPGAALVLGWNHDKSTDPLLDDAVRQLFAPAPLGDIETRTRFPGTTHVYDMLRRATLPDN